MNGTKNDPGGSPTVPVDIGGASILGFVPPQGGTVHPLRDGGMFFERFDVVLRLDASPDSKLYLTFQVVDGDLRLAAKRQPPVLERTEGERPIWRELTQRDNVAILERWINSAKTLVMQYARAYVQTDHPSPDLSEVIRPAKPGPKGPSAREIEQVGLLRAQGKSYSKIQEELKISKSVAHRRNKLYLAQQEAQR